jgi:DNA-binding Lrp family transcriptional regulator
LFEPGPPARRAAESDSAVRLDRTDRAILAALQKDAGLSNKELARKVRLAPSSCLERVRRLRATRALLGTHAEVAPEALGIGLEAIIAVRMNHPLEKDVAAWREQLLARPEVVGLYNVSGAMDFLVHVAVRDVPQLRELGAEAFTNHRIVAQIETSLIFEQWRFRALPDLAREEGENR